MFSFVHTHANSNFFLPLTGRDERGLTDVQKLKRIKLSRDVKGFTRSPRICKLRRDRNISYKYLIFHACVVNGFYCIICRFKCSVCITLRCNVYIAIAFIWITDRYLNTVYNTHFNVIKFILQNNSYINTKNFKYFNCGATGRDLVSKISTAVICYRSDF